jgi:hypothetical protein
VDPICGKPLKITDVVRVEKPKQYLTDYNASSKAEPEAPKEAAEDEAPEDKGKANKK